MAAAACVGGAGELPPAPPAAAGEAVPVLLAATPADPALAVERGAAGTGLAPPVGPAPLTSTDAFDDPAFSSCRRWSHCMKSRSAALARWLPKSATPCTVPSVRCM
jgi:hypothetical protein